MRDYQRKKNNPWVLPRAVYQRALWLARDYDRMRQAAEDTITVSREPGQHIAPNGGHSDPVFAAVKRREAYIRSIEIIDNALAQIPKEYRRGVWESVQSGRRYPDDAHRNTYSRWKSCFLYLVADAAGYI